jgi:hypothetical protein
MGGSPYLKIAFLDALALTAQLPHFTNWPAVSLDHLENLPGWRGIAVRQWQAHTGNSRDWVLCRPISIEFCSAALDWSNVASSADEAASCPGPYPLPVAAPAEARPVVAFVAPHQSKSESPGEIILLFDPPRTRDELDEWGIFARHLANLLFDRHSLASYTPRTTFPAPAATLEFLHLLQRGLPESVSRRSPILSPNDQSEFWAAQDAEAFSRLTRSFQDWLGCDQMFLVQRVTADTINVVLSAAIDDHEPLPGDLAEMIDHVLQHPDLNGTPHVRRVEFRTGCGPRQPSSPATLTTSVYACQVGGET